MQEHYPELFARIRRRTSPRAGSCRSAACGWSPTPTCPAARRWPASSCTASGSSSSELGVETDGGVAARLVRLLRRAAADRRRGRARAGSSPRRSPGTRRTLCRTTRSAGRASTAPGSSRTSRRSTPTTPSCPAAELARAERQFAEKGRANTSLVPFGYGDGGGGPDPGDAGRRAPHRVAGGLADRAARHARGVLRRRGRRVPGPAGVGRASCTWSSTAAPTPPRRAPSGQPAQRAPAARGRAVGDDRGRARGRGRTRSTTLRPLWQTVLLQQFHDILPGTSIAWVHREAERNYAARRRTTLEARDRATALRGAGRARPTASSPPTPRPYAVDGVPPRRGRCPSRPAPTSADRDGDVLDERRRGSSSTARADHLDRRPRGRARARAAGRAGNLLQLHRDTPTQWDAWDIDGHYRRTRTDLRRGRRDRPTATARS